MCAELRSKPYKCHSLRFIIKFYFSLMLVTIHSPPTCSKHPSKYPFHSRAHIHCFRSHLYHLVKEASSGELQQVTALQFKAFKTRMQKSWGRESPSAHTIAESGITLNAATVPLLSSTQQPVTAPYTLLLPDLSKGKCWQNCPKGALRHTTATSRIRKRIQECSLSKDSKHMQTCRNTCTFKMHGELWKINSILRSQARLEYSLKILFICLRVRVQACKRERENKRAQRSSSRLPIEQSPLYGQIPGP